MRTPILGAVAVIWACQPGESCLQEHAVDWDRPTVAFYRALNGDNYYIFQNSDTHMVPHCPQCCSPSVLRWVPLTGQRCSGAEDALVQGQEFSRFSLIAEGPEASIGRKVGRQEKVADHGVVVEERGEAPHLVGGGSVCLEGLDVLAVNHPGKGCVLSCRQQVLGVKRRTLAAGTLRSALEAAALRARASLRAPGLPAPRRPAGTGSGAAGTGSGAAGTGARGGGDGERAGGEEGPGRRGRERAGGERGGGDGERAGGEVGPGRRRAGRRHGSAIAPQLGQAQAPPAHPTREPAQDGGWQRQGRRWGDAGGGGAALGLQPSLPVPAPPSFPHSSPPSSPAPEFPRPPMLPRPLPGPRPPPPRPRPPPSLPAPSPVLHPRPRVPALPCSLAPSPVLVLPLSPPAPSPVLVPPPPPSPGDQAGCPRRQPPGFEGGAGRRNRGELARGWARLARCLRPPAALRQRPAPWGLVLEHNHRPTKTTGRHGRAAGRRTAVCCAEREPHVRVQDSWVV
ncbi:uncharacterized protein [Equus asinus]|uniref:uncharacterized protein n=1 Tax=Equus asinus TaxID=9793 RepID=UPI0038F78FFD